MDSCARCLTPVSILYPIPETEATYVVITSNNIIVVSLCNYYLQHIVHTNIVCCV